MTFRVEYEDEVQHWLGNNHLVKNKKYARTFEREEYARAAAEGYNWKTGYNRSFTIVSD